MGVLEKLLSGGTSKAFKTETFFPGTGQTAVAGLFSVAFAGEMGISGRSPVWNRTELNLPFTNAAGGRSGPWKGQLPTGPSFRVSDGGHSAFFAAGWNKAVRSKFDTTGSNLAR